ncbi:HNH endonuclease [Sphingobium abikonense]|uniref:HNH endonuclease n=1 Tax=Sphingobium abikonense TaxID=86193 RepID=UPI003515D3D6
MDNPSAFPAVPGFDRNLLGKFVSRIDAGDWSFGRCWNWTGGKTPKGYGVFAPSKKTQYRAHRFALMAYTGRPPMEMVLHDCDNPSCVNPKHLSEGGHGENMRQMAERKRAAREDRHHKAKLNFAEAAALTLLNRGGAYSTRELAEKFSIHQSTVAAIVNGSLWPDAHALADALLAERAKSTDLDPIDTSVGGVE